jgi:hypothetical protein
MNPPKRNLTSVGICSSRNCNRPFVLDCWVTDLTVISFAAHPLWKRGPCHPLKLQLEVDLGDTTDWAGLTWSSRALKILHLGDMPVSITSRSYSPTVHSLWEFTPFLGWIFLQTHRSTRIHPFLSLESSQSFLGESRIPKGCMEAISSEAPETLRSS